MRSKWVAIAATIGLMLLLYVLAYAPYLAFCYTEPEPIDGYFCAIGFEHEPYYDENHHLAFAPVEWLIDHTPLQEPLLVWGSVWGSDSKMRCDILFRYVDDLEFPKSEGVEDMSYPFVDDALENQECSTEF